MPPMTPFAQMPATPEPIIAQVRRQLVDDAHDALRVQGDVIDRVADRAVRELWGSRVKTFVPVLALRVAREMLREQDRLVAMGYAATHPVGMPSTAIARQDAQPGRDVFPIDEDILVVDDRDALSV